MLTQFYDKVDEYTPLDYTKNSYTQEEFEETVNDTYKLFIGFEIITSGEKKHALSLLGL